MLTGNSNLSEIKHSWHKQCNSGVVVVYIWKQHQCYACLWCWWISIHLVLHSTGMPHVLMHTWWLASRILTLAPLCWMYEINLPAIFSNSCTRYSWKASPVLETLLFPLDHRQNVGQKCNNFLCTLGVDGWRSAWGQKSRKVLISEVTVNTFQQKSLWKLSMYPSHCKFGLCTSLSCSASKKDFKSSRKCAHQDCPD